MWGATVPSDDNHFNSRLNRQSFELVHEINTAAAQCINWQLHSLSSVKCCNSSITQMLHAIDRDLAMTPTLIYLLLHATQTVQSMSIVRYQWQCKHQLSVKARLHRRESPWDAARWSVLSSEDWRQRHDSTGPRTSDHHDEPGTLSRTQHSAPMMMMMNMMMMKMRTIKMRRLMLLLLLLQRSSSSKCRGNCSRSVRAKSLPYNPDRHATFTRQLTASSTNHSLKYVTN